MEFNLLSKNNIIPKIKDVMPTPEKETGLVATLNKTGFMTTKLDVFTKKFLEFAKTQKIQSLEIGSAYGIAIIKALQHGINIIANDLDTKHLKILENIAIQKKLNKNLTIMPGNFPYDIRLRKSSISAVLCSRVFHFFRGKQIEDSIKLIRSILIPNGKIFLISETPYLNDYKNFIPIFEKRKQNNEQWPGIIENISIYKPKRSYNIPKMLNLLDPGTLTRVLEENGFIVEEARMFARKDYTKDLQLDGKESVGVVARKI